MKKAIKIILPSAAGAICIAFWIYTLNMIGTVNGEKIFFLNSALGNFYASAYRIFAAVSLVLLIVWILVAVKKVPKLIVLIKSKLTKEQTGERPSEETEKDDSADLKNDSFVDVPKEVPLVEEKIVVEKPVLQVPLTEKVVEEVVDPFEPAVVSAQASDSGSAAPVSGSAVPVSGSAAPVSDSAVPDSGSAALVSDSAVPVSDSAAPVVTSDSSSEDDNIICTKCGKSIPKEAKFCPFCGNKNS